MNSKLLRARKLLKEILPTGILPSSESVGAPDFSEYDELYREGDFRRAVFRGQDLLALHPDSAAARYKLGLALSRSNQVARALEVLTPIRDAVGPYQAKARAACAVLEGKERDASEWFIKHLPAGSSERLRDHLPSQSREPLWYRRSKISANLSIEDLDSLRKVREISSGMHDWVRAVDLSQNILLTGRANEDDLKKAVAFAAKLRDEAALRAFLAELNLVRRRNNRDLLSREEVLVGAGMYGEALDRSSRADVATSLDIDRWDSAQRRLHRAFETGAAIEVGATIAKLFGDNRFSLRTALYAEEIGMNRIARTEYARSASLAPQKRTIAVVRLARLIGEESGSPELGLLLAAPYWSHLDTTGTLRSTLVALAEETRCDEESSIGVVRAAHGTNQVARSQGSVSQVESLSGLGNGESDVHSSVELSVGVDLSVTVPDADGSDTSGGYLPGLAPTDARKRVASRYLAEGRFLLAAQEALRALYASGVHDPDLYYIRAYALARCGRYDEALAWIVASTPIASPELYERPRTDERSNAFRYISLLDTLPIEPGVFLWESNFGARVDCNPYAIWAASLDMPGMEDATHVWVANDLDVVPEDVADEPRTVIVRRESVGYWLALATASKLVNNASFPFEYMRRPGQAYANTWHGTPLKALGRDDRESPFDYGNVTRNLIHATNLIMPNQFTADIMQARYCVNGLLSASVEVTGHPRNDRLVRSDFQVRLAVRRRLGIDASDIFVLYAPTWRGSSTNSWFDTTRLEDDLSRLREVEGARVIFRGHPLSAGLLAESGLEAMSAPVEMSTYELMEAADVLITDYSSIGVDFLATGRPAIFYVYDYEEYRSDRGLYLSLAEFPGVVVREPQELIRAVESCVAASSLAEAPDSDRARELVSRDDGSAARRALRVILDETGRGSTGTKDKVRSRPRLLIAHSFENWDSTEGLIATLAILSECDVDVVLTFDHSIVRARPEIVQSLERVPDSIRVVPRKGAILETPLEKVARVDFYANDRFWSDEQRELYRRSIRREAQRLLGEIEFDLAISWGLESALWVALVGEGVVANSRAIVVDSDVWRDWEVFAPWRSRARELTAGFDLCVVAGVCGARRSLPFESEGMRVVHCERDVEAGALHPGVQNGPARILLPVETEYAVQAEGFVRQLSTYQADLPQGVEFTILVGVGLPVDVLIRIRDGLVGVPFRVAEIGDWWSELSSTDLVVDLSESAVEGIVLAAALSQGIPTIRVSTGLRLAPCGPEELVVASGSEPLSAVLAKISAGSQGARTQVPPVGRRRGIGLAEVIVAVVGGSEWDARVVG